jgi:hypothetical protein
MQKYGEKWIWDYNTKRPGLFYAISSLEEQGSLLPDSSHLFNGNEIKD